MEPLSQLPDSNVPLTQAQIDLLQGARARVYGQQVGKLQDHVARKKWLQRNCPTRKASAGQECFDAVPDGQPLRRFGGSSNLSGVASVRADCPSRSAMGGVVVGPGCRTPVVLFAVAQTGGDLYGVIVNVAVNAWMAGHIHGEDGCTGCNGSRSNAGHDWEARMRTITEMQPDITKWFDRDVWTRAANDTGFAVTRR
jgi:hypothetical protein